MLGWQKKEIKKEEKEEGRKGKKGEKKSWKLTASHPIIIILWTNKLDF